MSQAPSSNGLHHRDHHPDRDQSGRPALTNGMSPNPSQSFGGHQFPSTSRVNGNQIHNPHQLQIDPSRQFSALGHQHQQGQEASPANVCSAAALSPEHRGMKRTREHLAHCDCDDVDVPLSKRINGLNVERGRQQHPGQAGQQQEQQQQMQAGSFQENYPYAASSPYYASNHLLFHLYMERAQRQSQGGNQDSSKQ